ncbi:hypothetical protein SKAU_G00277360 [Synaphobranchus kaupii]|uniref:Uncharacterized protein n=1 Tax=Synaphobranchus kaupii TaxID=118154 RepID=A0A9Q1F1I0_SYNKA|nr:hypothetical protein SKAU_G00277360 [Synaphobranchus kaupii]
MYRADQFSIWTVHVFESRLRGSCEQCDSMWKKVAGSAPLKCFVSMKTDPCDRNIHQESSFRHSLAKGMVLQVPEKDSMD